MSGPFQSPSLPTTTKARPARSPRFRGLIAAPHTPFRDDATRSLDPSRIAEQAAFLNRSGVIGVFIGGSTGEWSSLTLEERLTLARVWSETVAPGKAGAGLKLLIHVGSNCQADSIALAAQARELKADAVAALAPSYVRPRTVADLVEFLTPIAQAAGDRPFFYYDIPSLTGVELPASEVLRLGGERWPNLAGLKFTNPDLMELQACLEIAADRFEVLFGVDELLLAAACHGVVGAIGTSYTCAAPGFARILAAVQLGDLEAARAAQREATAFVRAVEPLNLVRGTKAVCRLLGLDLGPCRPPLTPLTEEETERLRERIRSFNLFPQMVATAESQAV
jgi:N-acetylneuraminate lyase